MSDTDPQATAAEAQKIRRAALTLMGDTLKTVESLPEEMWTEQGRKAVIARRDLNQEQQLAYHMAAHGLATLTRALTVYGLALRHFTEPLSYTDPGPVDRVMTDTVVTYTDALIHDRLMHHMLSHLHTDGPQ